MVFSTGWLCIACILVLQCSSRMTDEQLEQLHDIQDGHIGKSEVEIVLAQYDENVSWSNPYSNICTVYCKGTQDLRVEGCHPLPNVGREGHTYLHHIVNNYDRLADWTVFSQAEMPTEGYRGHRLGGGHMMPGINFHDYVLRRGMKEQKDGTLFFFTSQIHLPTLAHVLRTSYMRPSKQSQQEAPSRCPAGVGGDAWGNPFDLGWFKKFLSKTCGVDESKLGELVSDYWQKHVAMPHPRRDLVHFAQGARFAASRERIHQRQKKHYEQLLEVLADEKDPCANYINEWLWYYLIGTPEETPCGDEMQIDLDNLPMRKLQEGTSGTSGTSGMSGMSGDDEEEDDDTTTTTAATIDAAGSLLWHMGTVSMFAFTAMATVNDA